MNEVIEKENIKIENMIYEIRGKQVMLVNDVAKLYSEETKIINQVIKRNINRFPKDFCFQLTQEETKQIILRSQIVTLTEEYRSFIHGLQRYKPYALTEQGIMMLSGLLKSDIAVEINIKIIDAFVTMRKYISGNLLEQKYINNQVMKNTEDIKLLQESFSKFEEKRKDNEIYFNGQIYDAYFKIYEIFNEAKKELIIIDNYADNTILDIIKRLKVRVTIITKENNLLTKQDIEKYNKQYHNLKVIYDNTFHDRYFIIDNDVFYHCGTSINRIGYKTFSITKVNDCCMLDTLLNKIHEI